MEQMTAFEELRGFEIQKSKGISPWALSLQKELGTERQNAIWSYALQEFSFALVEGRQSLWLITRFPSGGEVALRLAYCPDNDLFLEEILHPDDGIENNNEREFRIRIQSAIGDFHIHIEFPSIEEPLLHCTTTLTPSASLFIPFWPRDIFPLGDEEDISQSEGTIYTSQVGPRSGILYFSISKPYNGSVFYFQNLTSLNQYCEQTNTSLADVVGGQWPELGFSLPPALEKPLEAGKEITVSDIFMYVHDDRPQDDLEMSKQFLDSLANIYLYLPRMETKYIHWPDIVQKSLRDLKESPKCWTTVRTNRYLTAYVGDTETPPESMVQLSVLLPILEFSEWSGEEIELVNELKSNLSKFFDEEAEVYGRWLISKADQLDGSEEHKNPRVMDSWYLYHSLLNLSRLAESGDKTAKKLFVDSLEYVTNVARHFKYQWPVMYNIDTLEVVRAEAKEGAGGELDVAGQYTHLMMQARKITGDDSYIEEAKKAANSLKGLGFKLLYQSNSTLFSAGGLIRLWQETGDDLYLELSYLTIANIFNNMWLWECDYGYGRHHPTFFALFPLKDSEYTAVYEEIEAVAAFHEYLSLLDHKVPEWLNILIPEFIRAMLYKASFYYPANLPEEMISEKPRTGEIDRKLWIPLEDLHAGWGKAGQVGQEVYGSGLPFGLVPRHYRRLSDEGFMVYVEYPIRDFKNEPGLASFYLVGDQKLGCRMRLMPIGRKSLPEFQVQTHFQGKTETIQGIKTVEGHIEYELLADRSVEIRWSKKKSNSKDGKE
ncbi:MAG: hypothetical protein QM730_05045 [Anaerolineales bacterium]